jgi:hypothetical protein
MVTVLFNSVYGTEFSFKGLDVLKVVLLQYQKFSSAYFQKCTYVPYCQTLHIIRPRHIFSKNRFNIFLLFTFASTNFCLSLRVSDHTSVHLPFLTCVLAYMAPYWHLTITEPAIFRAHTCILHEERLIPYIHTRRTLLFKR